MSLTNFAAISNQHNIYMKRFLTIPFIAMLMACFLFPNSVMAGNQTTYSVPVKKKQKNGDVVDMKVDEGGRRSPSMPLCCTISKTDGVNITGLSEDIIIYEVRDVSNETTLVSFTSESDFLDYLFLQTGDFQLYFETENYQVAGYITIY